ncbi:MAG: RusA family crossover junction endodeoxyribonuclease [Helcococcus sp.]|nr:RusA family crossover junction endodeoxyribonuclease [Helcococcus sp.]
MEELKLVIKGRPITKKNSSQVICKPFPRLIPSKQFRLYEKSALWQIPANKRLKINSKCNMKCIYYMPTRHKVDLVNLLSATCDILVNANVIEDDNSNIIASHDGSRVDHDRSNPRVEVFITKII